MGAGNPFDNELFGAARAIRTDEFNVQLPYYFSQYYNDYQQISYQMSISGQDMILGYNAPVLNLLLIGKPFTWGYILFGNAYGLSWYWMSKLLLGMLVYFEVSKILTKNNLISFFGMFYVIFSPAIQWWFCPHMYDVFFWGAALLAIGYHFFVGNEKWKKILTVVLAIQAFICFIIALFPSLQVSVGLMAVAILIAVLIRDKNEISFNKIDMIRIAVVAITVILVVGSYLIPALGEIIIEVKGQKARLKYPTQFEVKVDTVRLEDSRLSRVWGKEIYRISLKDSKQKIKGEYKFVVEKI